MKSGDTSIPDNDLRLHAAWGLVLPYAERVVVIATQPPTGLLDWWRRGGTSITVLNPAALPDVAGLASSHDFDLLLFWDVAERVVRQQLRAGAGTCKEFAVWTAPTSALVCMRHSVAEAGLRRHRWSREARFHAWPDLHKPRQIIEHDKWTSTPLYMHRRSQKWWKTPLLQSSVGRFLAPASLSRWRRVDAMATASLLQRMVSQASESSGETLAVGDLRLSPNGVAIVRLQKSSTDKPFGILKVPLVEATTGRVAINAQALKWMQDQRHLFGNWSDAPPRLLAAEDTQGFPWTLEEHVVGSEAQTWEPESARQATVHLAELLGQYQRASVASTDVQQLQERLQPQVDKICALLSADLAQALQEIWRNTVRNLQDVRIPILPQHGDCKLENVLGDPRRPTQLRLLDWELWRPDGLPLLDLLHLLLSRRRRQAGYSIGGSICRWLLSWDFSPWEQRLMDGLAQGLDRQYVRATPVLYWLERIGPMVEHGSWPHTGWAQENVEQVIERMKQRQVEVLA